ncbi:MAG: AAA family ATPase [Candidatus Binatia bacterium]
MKKDLDFDEVLTQICEVLQRQGRVSYGALRRRFHLDDAYLRDLQVELIEAQQIATDEDGRVLVWVGEGKTSETEEETEKRRADTTDEEKAKRRKGEKEKDIHVTETLNARRRDSRAEVGERRQLTVLFCEIGKAATEGQLHDPDEWGAVLGWVRRTCEEVIRRYEGYTGQHLDDGMTVYWGYPTAHEDDAQRAVRAGLEIVRMVQRQDEWQVAGTLPVHVRVSIHTGPVTMMTGQTNDQHQVQASGETPQIAIHLLGMARPNTVVLSETTFRLVEGYFTCQVVGEPAFPGMVEPLGSYQVCEESGARNRLEAIIGAGFTPFVARDEELGLLRKRWEQVKEGRGQVVLLTGEAGIGKSRLIQELQTHLDEEQRILVDLWCSPYLRQSAFHPVTKYLQRVLHFERGETPEEHRNKLERALARWHLEDVLPLFATLLSLPLPASLRVDLPPQRQRQRLLHVIVSWLTALAERKPVLIVWEDLHWADPSTLDLLQLLIAQLPTSRILMVLSARPEFTSPWPLRSHITSLTLSRLGQADAETMVARVTRGKLLPPEVMQHIVSKTDGVPLFVEELTKMVLESGLVKEEEETFVLTGPLTPLAIPTTLQDSLLARLDRLSAVREVAQVGAVLGREFAPDLLQAVLAVDDDTLQQALDKLVDAEILYRRGAPPYVHYIFKHALIQDTAYQSLLPGRQQQYHQQVAQVLEEQFADLAEAQPELVAHHYTAAGNVSRAVPAWQRAGRVAIARSAFVEATKHLSRGLEVLSPLPETPERDQQELDLHSLLGPALMALKGYGAPEVEQSYARALILCRQGGETPRLVQVLLGLEMFYLTRGEVKTARELGEQCLALTQRANNPGRLLQAHLLLGNVLFQEGELVRAREHLLHGLSLYRERQQEMRHALQDPGVDCLVYLALVLWSLGYPEQALRASREAITLAEQLARPLSSAIALSFAAELHQFAHDPHAVLPKADAAIGIATEHDLPLWVAYGNIYRGWAWSRTGRTEEGVAQIKQGLTSSRATGAEVVLPWFLSMLADAYLACGAIAAGRATIAEAFTVMERKGERLAEAELYRIKGELTLQQFQRQGARIQVADPRPLNPDPQGEAESYFRKAIEVAHRQSAKSWELRAAVSLGRLWYQQGRPSEARQLVRGCCEWFTEGAATTDLQEARRLLESLNR